MTHATFAMKNIGRTQRTSFSALAVLMLASSTAFAGRPLVIDDAEPVEPWHAEFEAGAAVYENTSLCHWDFPAALTLGVLPSLEAGVGWGGQIDGADDDFGNRHTTRDAHDVSVGAKWKVLPGERFFADQALAFSWKIPVASRRRGLGSGEHDFDLTWIASKSIGDHFSAHLNAGYTWTGAGGEDDVFHYGVAAGWRVSPQVELVAEVYADTPLTAEEETTVVASGGLRWMLNDALVLDAAVGADLCGDERGWLATAGFTWTLDFGPSRTISKE
jgi:hypothetical protein